MALNGASGEPLIAVDGVGGDNAPHEVVKGALEAQERGVRLTLVGPRDLLAEELDRLGGHVPIVDAPILVSMDEPGTLAARKKGSSLHVACTMVQSGDAEAVVSCGNSGAIMAVATLLWRRQPGIDRAAFGSTLPSRDGGVFILDVGANPEVKAENLVQFAVMGEVFVRLQRGIASPRVALLSNGSEDSKGTKEIKEANQELRRANINFIGNVEGNHVFEGTVDVVVCDGFSGNILLKGAEGVGAEVLRLMREELRRDPVSRLAGAALKVSPAYGRIARKLDWEEYGGAPVLGVNGIMINCHGRSTAKSVTQGILLARTMASERLVERIGAALPEEVAESPGRTRRLVRALHLRHGEV